MKGGGNLALFDSFASGLFWWRCGVECGFRCCFEVFLLANKFYFWWGMLGYFGGGWFLLGLICGG